MIDRKLAEDLALLGRPYLYEERRVAALARVTAAIEHLERGAALLRASDYGRVPAASHVDWLEADTARRSQ